MDPALAVLVLDDQGPCALVLVSVQQGPRSIRMARILETAFLDAGCFTA